MPCRIKPYKVFHLVCVVSLLLGSVPLDAIKYVRAAVPLPTSPAHLSAFVSRLAADEAERAARHRQRVEERRVALAKPEQAQAPIASSDPPASIATSPPTPTTVFLPLMARNFGTISEAIVTPEEGGVAVSPNDRLRLDFPPGAVAAPTRVTVRSAGGAALAPRAVDRALFIELAAQELDGGAPVTSFSHPVQATAQYDPAALSDGEESRLTLRVRSGPGQAWRSLPSQVDPQAQTVSAPLLHFSELGLFTTSPFSDVTPVQLAPFIPLASSVGPGVFYAHTTVVTYTEGEVWLSSTPDGQGELFTDDVVAITVTHEGGAYAVYIHDYYDPLGSVYTTTAPVELSALFVPGVNTVAIELRDTRAGNYGTYGYYLTQPRNPYGRLLGGRYPTGIALNRLDVPSGNFMWRERDLSVFGLGPAVVFQRTYNSFDDSSGIFGAGWSSPFDSRLWRHFDGSVEVRRADGQRALFVPQGGGFAPEPGVFDRLERDGAGFVLTEKRSLTEYHYDGNGKLQSITDRHGNAVDIQYLGAEIRVTDAAKRDYTLHLSGGRVASITDSASRTVYYAYGAGGTLLTFTGLRGAPVEYGYNPLGRLNAVTNTLGVRVAGVIYDEYGRVLGYKGALGSSNTILRPQAHEATLVDAEGYRTLMRYDDRWRVEKLIDTAGHPVRYTYDERDLRLSISDQLSHTTRFGYDEAGNITTLANPLSHTLVYTYNSLDLPSRRVNADGAVIDYAYESADLTGVYQSGLLTLTIDYDDAGQIKKLENGGGNRLELGYDDHGDIVVVSSTLGYTTTYEYDGVGRIIDRTDTQSNTIGFGYEVGGAVTTITDSKNLTITYTYDSEGRVRTRADRLGHTTVYTYDARGLLSVEQDPLGNLTRYSYDKRGDMVWVVNARGYTTTYEYDGQRRVKQVTDAEGGVTRYLYDKAGRQTGLVNARGYTVTYEYDDAGRRVVEIDPLGNRTEYEYDDMARMIRQTDPRLNVTTLDYDEAGNLLEIVDALNHPTEHAYNEAGQRATTLYPDGGQAAYEYDEDGKLTTLIDPLDGVWQNGYDELGLAITRTDALSHSTFYGYDENRNVITETDALSNVVVYTYDAENRRTSRTRLADGAVWRTEYDALGRPIRATDPLSGTMVYEYDAVGNTVAVTGAVGGVTRYEYDGLNRRAAMVDAENQRTEYEYDGAGNLTVERICAALSPTLSQRERESVTSPPVGGIEGGGTELCASAHTKQYTYDAANRLIVVTDTLSHPTHYAYDAAGNRTVITNARGFTATFGYDPLNRVVTTTNALGDSAHVAYDEMGRVTARTDERNEITRLGYDLLGRQVVVTDALGNATWTVYDAVSNTIAITDARGYTTTFGYDALNRQTAITDALSYTATLAYDGAGNRIATTDTRGHTTRYGYDLLNRQVVVTDALDNAAYTAYDAVGNVVAITDAENQITRSAYDHLGQTLVVTDAEGGLTRYEYDVLGNVTAVTDARGFFTHYEYDGESQLRRMVDALENPTTYDYDRVGNRIAITDALGNETGTVYDALDRPAIETDALGHSMLYFYDAVGNPVEVEDRRGYTTTYEYDPLNRVTATTDAEGHTVRTAYDALGNTIAVTGARGYTTTLAYDPLNRQTVVTGALAYTTTMVYDPAGNVARVVDALGFVTAYGYDPLNRQVVVTDALWHTTTMAYDAVGNTVAVVNARGYSTTFAYDGLGRQVVVTDALSYTTTFAYDALGNTVAVTNARGYTTTYGYDPLNRQVAITDALSYTTTMAYDVVGNLIETRDKRGYTTTYGYDAVYNQVAITDALDFATRYDYDAERNVIATTDANTHTTRVAYNGVGQPLAVTDPLTGTWLTFYDENYNVTATVSARGFTTTYGYDPLNRQMVVTDPLSHTTHTAYDALGRAVVITDAEENRTRYAYDALGRPITVTDALSGTTVYEYDALGNRIAQTGANGNSTTFEYDPLDRQVLERDPLGNEWAYTYDANGNLVRREDASGAVTRYIYDPLDRRARTHYPADPSQDVVFGYDPNGNVTQMTDPLGALLAEYDPLNRVTQVTDYAIRNTQYAYDPVGNLTRLTYPNGNAVSYTYNPNDWLETTTDPNANVTRYGYNPDGLVTQILYGNTTWADYGYDEADQLTSVYVGSPEIETGLVRAYDYTLDRVGNRTQTVERYTQGEVRTIEREHEYDALYRLTAAVEVYEGPPGEVISSTYSYDEVGNRLEMTTNRPEKGGPPEPPVTTEYEYNEANWLEQRMENGEWEAGYAYDASGNRTQVTYAGGIVETYQYDLENRLVVYERTEDNSDRYVYARYDGLGRRVEKGTQEGSGGVEWTEYVYQQLTMDTLAEFPQTGPPRVTYLYRGRAGTLVEMEEQQGDGEGHEYWFAQDGLGSVAAVTKQDGQSAHEYFYTPFGGIVDDNGHPEDSSNWTDPHNHYLLTGKEWDEEMELYYFGARYYDAASGVWLTQDVYRGQVEQPLTLHRTLYALANPVNNVDAYGYRVIANGYGGYGGGGGPVDTGNPAPSSNPSSPGNSSPCHWDGNGDNGGSGGGGGGGGGRGGRDEPEDQLGVLSWQPLTEWESIHSGGIEQVWLQGGLEASSPLEQPDFSLSYTDPLYFDDPRILNEGLPPAESYTLAAVYAGQTAMDIPAGFAEGVYETGVGLAGLIKGVYRLTIFNKLADPQDYEAAAERYNETVRYVASPSHFPEIGGAIVQGFVAPYREALETGRPGKAIGRGAFDALMLYGTAKSVQRFVQGKRGVQGATTMTEAMAASPLDEMGGILGPEGPGQFVMYPATSTPSGPGQMLLPAPLQPKLLSAGTVVEYGSGSEFANAGSLVQDYPGARVLLTEAEDVGLLAQRTGAYDKAIAAGAEIRLGDYNQIIPGEGIRPAASIAIAPQPGYDPWIGKPVKALQTAHTMAETIPGGRIYVAAAEENVAQAMADVFSARHSIRVTPQEMLTSQIPYSSRYLGSTSYVIDFRVPTVR